MFRWCVAAQFHGASRMLREWIEYHAMLGAEKFYLVDHHNTCEERKKTDTVLKPMIKSGLVELLYNENPLLDHVFGPGGFVEFQNDFYRKIIAKVKILDNMWVACIDVDEFMLPLISLSEIFKKYSQASLIGMRWQNHGTSFVPEISSSELWIDRLVWRMADNDRRNQFSKFLVRAAWFVDINTVHLYKCCKGYEAQANPQTELTLNHYFLGDEAYFDTVKRPMYSKMTDMEPNYIEKRYRRTNVEYDARITKFSRELKKIMGFNNYYHYEELSYLMDKHHITMFVGVGDMCVEHASPLLNANKKLFFLGLYTDATATKKRKELLFQYMPRIHFVLETSHIPIFTRTDFIFLFSCCSRENLEYWWYYVEKGGFLGGDSYKRHALVVTEFANRHNLSISFLANSDYDVFLFAKM